MKAVCFAGNFALQYYTTNCTSLITLKQQCLGLIWPVITSAYSVFQMETEKYSSKVVPNLYT